MDFNFYPFSSFEGSINMALDKNLLEISKKKSSINLRFYLWSFPTISLGRSQIAKDIIDFGFCKKNGIKVVKRPTGGRALLHNKEITFCITGPLDGKKFPKNFQENYNLISMIILMGLKKLRIPAEIKEKEIYKTSPKAPIPCFSEPAPGEIMVNGKKIVGTAMLVEEENFLVHGSILIDFDEKIQRGCFLKKEEFFVSKLINFLKPLPSWREIINAFLNSFEEKLKIKFKKKQLGKKILQKAEMESFKYKILNS